MILSPVKFWGKTHERLISLLLFCSHQTDCFWIFPSDCFTSFLWMFHGVFLLPTEISWTFRPGFLLHNKLCTRRIRGWDKTKILVFHSSDDGGGRCLWLHLHKNKSLLNPPSRTDGRLVILYNSTPEQENTVCRSSLRHYRWFKVLREKKYFYIFLMFGQQWTIAQPETETSPTNQLNVFERSTGSDRRSTTPSIRILVHTGVLFWLN